MKKNVHVFISGRVQGVFFRANTKQKAENLGITGWVRNTSDGRVEGVFEGEEDKLENMIEWCHHGPSHANVENVEVTEEKKGQGYQSFKIKY